MGVKDKFHKLSLSRQMQILFIISSLLICVTLIIITKFQLDWLEKKLASDSNEVYESRIKSQMKALALIEVKGFQSEFSNYVVFVEILKRTDEIFHEANSFYSENPFNTSTAYPDYLSTDLTFDHGVYYSRRTIGSEGAELVKTESCFNKIYPTMYSDVSWGYYQGYEVDDLFMFYPGIIVSNDYNPKVREWYYKAIQNTSITIITEPYIDSSFDLLLVSFSKAILNKEGEYFGVAAYDVALATLTKKAQNIKILESGFAILATKKGMMLNTPEPWRTNKTESSNLIKIFDSLRTGITTEQWEEIKSQEEGVFYKFTDSQNIVYRMLKKDIRPFYDSDEITHYLLMCVKNDEISSLKEGHLNTFNDNNVALFWLILSFGIVIFFAIFVLISVTVRKMRHRMGIIENALGSIIMRALFEDLTKKVVIPEFGEGDKETESLTKALEVKINDLKEKEIKFNGETKCVTRPNDKFIYNDWKEIMYPLNSNYQKKLAIREIFYKLKKKT